MTISESTPPLDFGRKPGALALGILLAALAGRVAADEARPADHLRIAILAYQDAEEGLRSVERALIGLRADAGISQPFTVARGTYADLWHWLEARRG